MKKPLLITLIVSTIALILITVWVYFFIFSPKSIEGIFSGFGGTSEPTFDLIDENRGNVNESNKISRLKQLTTRPVIGAAIVRNTIRYSERGTGHIYEMDLGSGTETLLSGTTIPFAVHALFSEDGERVAVTSEESRTTSIVVGRLGEGDGETLVAKTLPQGAKNVAFSTKSTSTTDYLLPATQGSRGISYNINTGKSETLFTLPLRDIEVMWGDPTYVYTTPSSRSYGSIYKLRGSELAYVTKSAPGLMGIRINGGVAITRMKDGVLSTSASLSDFTREMPISLFPEKCTLLPDNSSTLYCATNLTKVTGDMPDKWYKGATSFSDYLFKIDGTTGEGRLYSDFLTESGREIDVDSIGTNDDGTYVYFINKNDDTLWLFDATDTDE